MARQLARRVPLRGQRGAADLDAMRGGTQRRRHPPCGRRLDLVRARAGGGNALLQHARTGTKRRQFALRFDEVDRERVRRTGASLADRFELDKLAVGDLRAPPELRTCLRMAAKRARGKKIGKRQRDRLALRGRRMEMPGIECRQLDRLATLLLG